MSETITKTRSTTETTTREPGKFKVVAYNDDKTPIEFVIAMLVGIFRHSEAAAVDITMKIHNEGKGTAGVYTYEVAEQKGVEATNFARKEGHPLVIKVEPE